MPNDYFRFKEFTVCQKTCAMKVCTDSCVLGAYAASEILHQNLSSENVLDIGAGTGLLGLMLSQKIYGCIDAVELQEQCWKQMHDNFQNSPWKERLHSIHADIKKWNAAKKYDFIISNPPFYENDMKGKNASKSIAMHDSGLILGDLIHLIRLNISDKGNFCVMIPASRKAFFEKVLAAHQACIASVLALRHRKNKAPFRLIYLGNFYSTLTDIHTSELTIELESGYTEDFKNLLRDYYLAL